MVKVKHIDQVSTFVESIRNDYPIRTLFNRIQLSVWVYVLDDRQQVRAIIHVDKDLTFKVRIQEVLWESLASTLEQHSYNNVAVDLAVLINTYIISNS